MNNFSITHLIHGKGDDVVNEDDRLHDAEEDVDDGHDDPGGGGSPRKRWKQGRMFENRATQMITKSATHII